MLIGYDSNSNPKTQSSLADHKILIMIYLVLDISHLAKSMDVIKTTQKLIFKINKPNLFLLMLL